MKINFKDKRIWIGVAAIAILIFMIYSNYTRTVDMDTMINETGRAGNTYVWLKCTDTDGGKNTAVYGQVVANGYWQKPKTGYGGYSFTSFKTTQWDRCLTFSDGSTFAREYYCSGKEPKLQDKRCYNGCSNGMCKK